MIDNKMHNQLISEKSPYLLQHADNPVNWYPWCQKAFEKAKKEDKPIFLSIGYSTCHWCHVMAHESFEDEEVAEALNKNFISIKVDREERPDIDAVYMNITQRMNGQGGWPLTIIMTPEQKPFFAATYIPKTSGYNMMGLLEILRTVSSKWENSKNELINSSEMITETVKSFENDEFVKSKLTKDMIHNAFEQLKHSFDGKYGGFGRSPKFPQPGNLLFLLNYYKLENNEDALYMVNKTLESMYKGGIFDHVGYGFSRYSTDEKWLVPHFEKMLYDNAQLVIAYTEAYLLTKIDLYKDISMKTLDYILNEMTDAKGGFYSAQDADSEGEEGKYYIFTPEEIIKILGEDDGKYFNEFYNINKNGNFEGKNIPNLLHSQNHLKTDLRIEELSKKVYNYRLKRTKLHKDDKILSSWNGLMAAAFAVAYKAYGNKKYLEAANDCINFIEKNLIYDDNNIGARYRDGDILKNGTLDDYAFFIWALIEIYEAVFDFRYLELAIKLNKKMITLFWDDEKGGFFMSSQEEKGLIYNPKEVYDGAMPSGNSVASYNIIRLARLTGEAELEELAGHQIQFLANKVSDYPSGYTFALISMMYELYPSKEIICLVKDNNDLAEIRNIINNNFLVNTSILAVKYSEINYVKSIMNLIKGYDLKDNKTTVYICENKNCSLPITDIEKLKNNL